MDLLNIIKELYYYYMNEGWLTDEEYDEAIEKAIAKYHNEL